MNASSKFLFDRDFTKPPGRQTPSQAEALAEAERQGYARGLVEGEARARAEADRRLDESLRRIADGCATLLSRVDSDRTAMENEAVAFALAFARKLAGDALARFPLAAMEMAARSAFEHLRGVPHLVVRVNEGIVDEAQTLVNRIGRERGFEGRIVMLGEPDIVPGDARFEWADGGVVREGARIGEAAARALSGG